MTAYIRSSREADSVRRVPSRWISDAKEAQLRYALRLENTPRDIKKALQTLCTYYESGQSLRDATEIRQLIHSHLHSLEVLLRRWSMKALGLIGNRDDAARLVDRLKVETDAEAQTWGMAALLRSATDRGLQEVCTQAGLDHSTPLVLAARLYAPGRWLRQHSEEVIVRLSDDDLTLKWAIFLAGYDRAPTAMFDPRHENAIFLGELNQHDTPEISEYSVWALWERPDYDVEFLRVPLDEIDKHPENVRKWLYRLVTQSPDKAAFDPDLLSQFRNDPSASAREGLALGVADLSPKLFGTKILDWYSAESDKGVKDNLLTSIASRSSEDSDFRILVEEQFGKAEPNSVTRRRLLAASEGTPVWGKLMKRLALEKAAQQGSFPVEGATMFQVEGDLIMSGGPSIKVTGDLNAQTVVAGEMIASANAAVQNLSSSREADAKVLSRVLEYIGSANVPEELKLEIANEVRALSESPTPERKASLLSKLKGLGMGASAGGGVAEIISLVQAWVA